MCTISERCNPICLFNFTTNRGSIFTVQSHVKYTNAELLRHVGLQLQAPDHARLYTAVVVTHGQQSRNALGA